MLGGWNQTLTQVRTKFAIPLLPFTLVLRNGEYR